MTIIPGQRWKNKADGIIRRIHMIQQDVIYMEKESGLPVKGYTTLKVADFEKMVRQGCWDKVEEKK